jgi:hypothetical protein
MDLKKASHMIKQMLSSSLFGWKELMKYSGINDAFFSTKKQASAHWTGLLRRRIARMTR